MKPMPPRIDQDYDGQIDDPVALISPEVIGKQDNPQLLKAATA